MTQGEQGLDAPAPDDPPEPPLPLEALDRALAPVRQVVRYAVSGRTASAKYVEANTAPWIEKARALALPTAIHDVLDEVARSLAGLDTLEEGRADRLQDVHQALWRLDSLLGLPLPVSVVRRRSPRKQPPQRSRRSRPPPSSPAQPAAAPEPPKPAVREATPLAALLDDRRDVAALAEAGVVTVADLLALVPVGERVVGPISGAGRALEAGPAAVSGRVLRRWTVLRPGAESELYVLLQGAGPALARWRGVGAHRCAEELAPDVRAVLVGTWVTGEGTPHLWDGEPGTDDGERHVRLQRYDWPGLDDRIARAAFRRVAPHLPELPDPLEKLTLEKPTLERPSLDGRALDGRARPSSALVPRGRALAEVHALGRSATDARRRLAFDEALNVHLGLAWARYQPAGSRGISHSLLHLSTVQLERAGVTLADVQQRVLEDIKRDLRTSRPMRRVVTGPVGAGKGALGLMAAVTVADSRSQVFMLAADGATAEQRFVSTEPMLREAGLVARLLAKAPGRAMRDAIKRGEVHVVFGTFDLLEANIEARRLGLVVAQERQPWGRSVALVDKLRAPRPDLLALTSVPLGPRALLEGFPDCEVSHLGHARPPAYDVSICGAAERAEAYEQASSAVQAGGQVVVVFPLVRGTDALDVQEAGRLVRALEADAFRGQRVRLFHGGMSREDRARALCDMAHRRADVLVATAVIEEAHAMPGVAALIVEQADRVDPLRLHRVIGWMSSSSDPARVVLVVGELAEPDAARRVERALAAADEQWVATEAQDVYGARSHPPPQLKWLAPATDHALMLEARSLAHELLRDDPGLRKPGSAAIAGALHRAWSGLWPPKSGFACPITEAPTSERRKRRRRRRKR